MALKKRCIWCHKPLDEKGRCQNKACVEYLHTKILEADDVAKLADKSKDEEK